MPVNLAEIKAKYHETAEKSPHFIVVLDSKTDR